MGLFPRLRLQKRDLSLSNPKAWDKSLWNLQGMQSHTGVMVTETTALNYSAVFNAINIISGDLASIPLCLYNKKDTNRKKALTHNLYPILHDVANSEMTAMTFRETIIAHILAWGNGFAEKEINGFGKITALWPIPPTKIVEIKRENRKLVYYVDVNGQRIPVPRERMLHIPGLGFNGIEGYSVISKAKESIGLGLATEEFGARFFGSGTHPGLVVSHPGSLSKPAFDNLSGELDRKYSGLGKSHRLMLLEEDMKIEKIGVNPEDAQFLETRQFQIPEIARWFNIQPHKLKDHSRSTFNNIEQLQIDHVVHCLRPWAVRIEQNLNMQLLGDKERRLGYYFEHNLEGLLRGDAKTRAEYYRTRWMIGTISQNEIREKENENPIDDGDEYYVPLNMIPASKQDDFYDSKTQITEKKPEEPIEEEEKARIISFFTKEPEIRKIALPIARDRIRRSYIPIFQDAAQRIINKESKAIQKAANDLLSKRGSSDFRKWLKDFYSKMPEYIRQIFGPVVFSYIEMIGDATAKEINIDIGPELDKEIKQFIDDYLDNYESRHVLSSIGQIESILDSGQEDLGIHIESRATDWQDKRSEKISLNESNRSSNSVAQLIMWSAGYSTVWRIRGADTCAYCRNLDGKKIKQGQSFFEGNGEEYKPHGADVPMRIWGMKKHPPLHAGCDCFIGIK